MKHSNESISLPLSAALLARVQAAATEEHRPAAEIVRDALESYLGSRLSRRNSTGNKLEAEMGLAAAARIRELRRGNILPEGVTIRNLIDEGRA
jgi:hypothetical protein